MSDGDTARGHDPTKQRRVAEHYLLAHDDTAKLNSTVSLAATALAFPIGQINILDDRLMYTIGDYHSGIDTLPRENSLCQFLIDDGVDVLAVDDLRAHERYRNIPAVRDGLARSYLGVPLASREATAVGTLCVIDAEPRHITDAEIERIVQFGHIVEDQLDLIRRNAETPASREVSALLAAALAADEIVPWYQPVVALDSGVRTGFEALARWQRPDGSIINPDGFIAAAEDSDLVIDLDRAVVQAALRDLARWRRTDPSLRVGVNLSTRHLELPDGSSFMADAARNAGVDPDHVVIEITETRLLGNLERAAVVVDELQAAGFLVVLDDFANGFSNLDWLLGLGVNGIKIDRSVTTALGTRVGNAVCRAVAGLAAELDMLTTIEGIGDEEHLAAAKAHGFNLGQGYYWSPPVPAVVVDAAI